MTDPSRRDGWGQEHPGTYSYPVEPGETDGRRPRREPVNPPPAGLNPTQQLPAYSPYGPDPYGTYGIPPQPPGPPPEPPRRGGRGSRAWLWVLAALALILVVGLILSLLIDNSSQEPMTAEPQTPLPSEAQTTATSRPPTTTRSTRPRTTPSTTPSRTALPPDSTSPGATHTVVYTVAGEGRAISILYLDTGGILQTEFNVLLPWSKQVELTGQANLQASVSIVNVGREISCAINIDGVQTQQRTGTGLTLCNALGGR